MKIPRLHHNQSPWPSAQEQINKLNAYRTPKDKVNCVFNCCSVIMNLLSLCEKSVPAADDLIPVSFSFYVLFYFCNFKIFFNNHNYFLFLKVLVFVIIKSNPPSLLSTIEFIKTYYEDRLDGEQLYFWTQFCSATQFIKTMDY